ncbi:hypothetical protein FQA39_LY01131 [Lamprigera yunnana]|nr:hypothetical protein FQA39_LY01131 [Lamprigera yunnana]
MKELKPQDHGSTHRSLARENLEEDPLFYCKAVIAKPSMARLVIMPPVHPTSTLDSGNLDFLEHHWLILVNTKDNCSCSAPDDRQCMNAYVLVSVIFVFTILDMFSSLEGISAENLIHVLIITKLQLWAGHNIQGRRETEIRLPKL